VLTALRYGMEAVRPAAKRAKRKPTVKATEPAPGAPAPAASAASAPATEMPFTVPYEDIPYTTVPSQDSTVPSHDPTVPLASDPTTPIDPTTYNDRTPWTVLDSYFRENHLARLVEHQIQSYNDLVTFQLPRTIAMFNPVTVRSEQDLDKETGKYRLELFVSCEDFNIFRPQIHENNGATKLMFPQEARLRNFTYSAKMTVRLDLKIVVRSGDQLEAEQVIYKSIPNVEIGKIPIMLKSSICVLQQYKHVPASVSGECAMDPGGYFIINGSEKTCLGQERAAENQVQCFDVRKNNSKWSWQAEIKSVPDYKCISPKQICLMMSAKSNGFGFPIFVQLPRVKTPLPLFTVFRCLGVLSDQDICEHILLSLEHENTTQLLDLLQSSIVYANKHLDQETALQQMTSQVMYTPMNMDKETGARKKREFALEILNTDLFPHCRTAEQKRFFLGYMTKCLLLASMGIEEQDDRDAFHNKRVDMTGTLLNNLFRNYFNKMVKDMQKQIVREINNGSWRSTDDFLNIVNPTNIYKIIKSTTVENGFKRALATGDFGVKQVNSTKVGVAQVLNRLTYISSLSHLRRVNTPIDKSGKLVPPRRLHSTSWGFVCPAETPEGGSVGVVKNLSYMAQVTIPCNSSALYEYVAPFVTALSGDTAPTTLFDKVKVFVNGCWLGVAEEPLKLYDDLKEKKVRGIINIYTSILFDYRRMEIRVCNDAGRLTRPLLRVKNNTLVLTQEVIEALDRRELVWNDLLTDMRLPNAVIEYIDAAEQNAAMLAMTPKQLTENTSMRYTHCEIHPSTIFGILASCIPFPDHNQSPRNTYQCAMGKQAMGWYVTNYDQRMDKTAHVLLYPTRPLVETRVMNMIELNQVPSGCQVIVAIMTHTGFNQEDSVLLNQGSIDRGLFQAVVYHTEKDEDKKIHGDEEIRCRPEASKTKGMKYGNYDKLNTQGVMPENSRVENRDIIIGKVLPIKEARNDHTKPLKYEDQSRIYRTTEDTYVDKNLIDRNGEGYNFCKVRLRTLRKPVIGDKFSSRHGQKGTAGNIIPEHDMPFTSDGLRPDIIINPHAIPSRMTIAQLKETLLGKVLLQLGLFGDGTSFGDIEVQDISRMLQRIGYESHGNEIMYNGLSGEQLETSIFIGPVFYQRLKHMVIDKQHSRSIGPMVNLTRQPAVGRSKDGGLRFGEMERDGMCSHGASRFTKGRMYDDSDAYRVHVCKRCGLIAAYNDQKHIHLCKTCDNRTDFAYVELPYSCKLLFQELQTMNVAPRVITQ
jgi:DNA-directed RNA polymerase II subunit RPB2